MSKLCKLLLFDLNVNILSKICSWKQQLLFIWDTPFILKSALQHHMYLLQTNRLGICCFLQSNPPSTSKTDQFTATSLSVQTIAPLTKLTNLDHNTLWLVPRITEQCLNGKFVNWMNLEMLFAIRQEKWAPLDSAREFFLSNHNLEL